MAARQASTRVALGLGALGRQAEQVAERSKAVDFFREVARCVPWVIHNYHLEELISGKEMRKNIAALFRQHADVKSPQVIDLLIYKGRGELESVILQHKQRHHLVTDYVREPAMLRDAQAAAAAQPSGCSKFLEGFYDRN